MNALTVDVEDYYQSNGLNIPIDTWSSYESRVDKNTRLILDCFEEHGVKATFFIVGCIATQNPQLVKEIARRGHEIGSHSGWHQMLNKMTADEFRDDVRSSKQLLEDISGLEVYQYRAPSWSLDVSRYGWLSILEEEGYRIDSSIQPFRTPLSGSANAPLAPFRPIINDRSLSLIEYPSTVWNWRGLRIPFSGGLYFRCLPLAIARRLLRSVNRSRTGMVYIHPWELDPDQPRLPASLLIRFAMYYRLRDTRWKLDQLLLDHFNFMPLGRVVESLLEANEISELKL